MKATGVVVEYNPFHNGHLYHLQQARTETGADIIIAVMSGHFLQRGEPALISKWARTKMALLNGADIVFELPYQFSTQKAQQFAAGAVTILDAAGSSYLCFGSEAGDSEAFIQTANFLRTEKERYDELIQQHIQTGVSYPRAAAMSVAELHAPDGLVPLSQPNNILGYHYVNEILEQGGRMIPKTIMRKSAGYHDQDFNSSTIASATAIRKSLFGSGSDLSSISKYMPASSAEILSGYKKEFGALHHWELYWPFLKYRLLHSRPAELSQIYEAEEGLENRLIEAARKALTFSGFMELAKTKRYTWTRIQRLCTHILVNAGKEEMGGEHKASYLRLLGITGEGRLYLNKNKKHFPLPVVSKLSSFKENDIGLDLRATAVYSMALAGKAGQKLLEMEYTQPPVLLNKGS